jgi:hypothetical protein
MNSAAERTNRRRGLTGPLGLFVWLFVLFFMAPVSASWAGSLRADPPLPQVQYPQARGFERAYPATRDVVVLAGQGSHEKQRHAGGDPGLAPAAQALTTRIGSASSFAWRRARPTPPARVQAYQARAPPGLSRRAGRPGAQVTQHI